MTVVFFRKRTLAAENIVTNKLRLRDVRSDYLLYISTLRFANFNINRSGVVLMRARIV